ncbi:MAG: hypothetical protein ACYSUB_01865 [Planctomycetota bacterium]|jgi:hypothetical protein
MNIQKTLVQWDEETRQQEEALALACKEATAVFKKHYPTVHGNLDAPQTLAACVELFDLEDHKDAGQLYLEWLVEHYVGRKVAANLDDVKTIVKALKAAGYTEDNPYCYNDCDNQLFYIPHKEKLIFCAESQNTRYIYILCLSPIGYDKFHIRRYYDEYDFDGEKDEWQLKEEATYKGIRQAITAASWLAKEWSDCISGNPYPERPSLQYLKDGDFNLGYGDCRDIGYVLSYENVVSPRVDGALFYYLDIKLAFFGLRCAIGEVENFEVY